MISEFDLPFLLRSPSWSTYFFFLADAILVLNELTSFAAPFALFPTLRTGEGNIYAKQMKHALAVKGANNLNVYTVGNPPSDDGNVLFGYTQFPWKIKKDPESDGVVIQFWTPPDPGVVSPRRVISIRLGGREKVELTRLLRRSVHARWAV